MPDGKLSVDSQVPFAGIYAVLTQGGFFADTQVRFDFYKNTLTDASNGLAAQTLDARGISVTGNLGYNIKLPSDWFIEPSVGAVWSHVSVDDFTSAGVFAPRKGNLFPPLLLGIGTVQFDDIESLLGARASVSEPPSQAAPTSGSPLQRLAYCVSSPGTWGQNQR